MAARKEVGRDETRKSSIAMASQPPDGIDFRDLDDGLVFDEAQHLATAMACKNFVVEFGADRARIAYDLNRDQFEALLTHPRDEQYPIRWVNVWGGGDTHNENSIRFIGNHYKFSKRLTSLMVLKRRQDSFHSKANEGRVSSGTARGNDIEQGLNGGIPKLDPNEKSKLPLAGSDGLDMYLLVKNTVNYFDIDLTPKALCIGAHWLHDPPAMETAAKHDAQLPRIMPPRHWRWLALCNDHTVISIHDAPNHQLKSSASDSQTAIEEELKNMRLNTFTVLAQLSERGFEMFNNRPLSQAAIRQTLRSGVGSDAGSVSFLSTETDGVPHTLAAEGSSNLFYYLFEDYVAASPLKTAVDILEKMTKRVLDSTNRRVRNKASDIIPVLHYLSKDLRELKHLFEGYSNLVRKIMSSSKTNGIASPRHVPAPPVGGSTVTEGSALGHLGIDRKVLLTESALNRFDRLSDRLQWLMLNTIEGTLEEISALSGTYFNLTQQKDSSATARLTRSATLLAKLSVFFLPISFMTSYFSVQIEDLFKYWNGSTYWNAFAVIASVSFVSLFFFSRLLMFFSDVLDEWAERIAAGIRRVAAKVGFKVADEEETFD